MCLALIIGNYDRLASCRVTHCLRFTGNFSCILYRCVSATVLWLCTHYWTFFERLVFFFFLNMFVTQLCVVCNIHALFLLILTWISELETLFPQLVKCMWSNFAAFSKETCCCWIKESVYESSLAAIVYHDKEILQVLQKVSFSKTVLSFRLVLCIDIFIHFKNSTL